MYRISNIIMPSHQIYQNLSTLPTTTTITHITNHCFPVQSPVGGLGPPESAILNKL